MESQGGSGKRKVGLMIPLGEANDKPEHNYDLTKKLFSKQELEPISKVIYNID